MGSSLALLLFDDDALAMSSVWWMYRAFVSRRRGALLRWWAVCGLFVETCVVALIARVDGFVARVWLRVSAVVSRVLACGEAGTRGKRWTRSG